MTELEQALADGGTLHESGTPVPPSADQKPHESRMDKFMGAFGKAADAIGAGVGSAAEFASHPMESIQNPSMRREFERGLDSFLTFGAGQRLAKAADESPVGQWFNRHFGGPQNALGHGQEVEDQAAAPGARQAGMLGAALIPGGAAGLGGQATGLGTTVAREARSLIPATGKISGALGGAAAGTLGAGASGAMLGAGQAHLNGESPGSAALGGLLDPVSLTLGAGGGSLGGAAHGEANAIRNPSTPTGRALREVEASGGRVNMTGEPVTWKDPELSGAKPGQGGSFELDNQLMEQMKANNRAKLAAERENYGREQAAILESMKRPMAGGHVLPAPEVTPGNVRAMLERLDAENHYPGYDAGQGLVRNGELDKAIRRMGMDLTSFRRVKSVDEVHPRFGGYEPDQPSMRDMTEGSAPPTRAEFQSTAKTQPGNFNPFLAPFNEHENMLIDNRLNRLERGASQQPSTIHSSPNDLAPSDAITPGHLLQAKQTWNDAAEWGQPATKENAPYRMLIGAVNEDIAAMDPRLKALNAKYGSTMQGLKEANDILFGKNAVDFTDRAHLDRKAVNKLERQGDTSRAALSEDEQMQRLGQLSPENARLMRLSRAKKAGESLRYGAPQTSTSLAGEGERAGRKVAGHMVGAMAGSGAGPIGAAVGGAAGGALGQNANQLRARVALPVAERTASLTGAKAGAVHQFTQWTPEQLAAIRDAQRQQNELRAQLAGGQ